MKTTACINASSTRFFHSRDITHHEETDDIVGVGFVAPKPGIFVDSVKQLMVIATAREVKILGIANGPDGLQFVNSFMTTLTNGVHMHQIIGTSQGRIFMLGNDDNVWELDYRVSVVMKRYSQEVLNSCNFSGKGNLVHQQMLQKSAHHWQLSPVFVWQTKRPYCTTGSQRGWHHFIPIDPKLIDSCCILGNRRRYI